MIGSGCVPGFGDNFGIGQHRILANRFDQRRIGYQLAGAIAAENGREIEAKTVDVIIMDPVSQAMKNHFADDGVVAVDGVSATRIVFVIAFVVFQHVIDGVFQTLEAQDRSSLVAFASVIENDIQDDFDSRFVQSFDHLFEFGHLGAGRLAGRISTMWREECQRIVAPIILTLGHGTVTCQNREFVNRH